MIDEDAAAKEIWYAHTAGDWQKLDWTFADDDSQELEEVDGASLARLMDIWSQDELQKHITDLWDLAGSSKVSNFGYPLEVYPL